MGCNNNLLLFYPIPRNIALIALITNYFLNFKRINFIKKIKIKSINNDVVVNPIIL